MQGRTSWGLLILGAVAGGLIAALFPARPAWLWSLASGCVGGGLGVAAAALLRRPWPWVARAAAATVVLLLGLTLLGLVLGRVWIVDPANWTIRSPHEQPSGG